MSEQITKPGPLEVDKKRAAVVLDGLIHELSMRKTNLPFRSQTELAEFLKKKSDHIIIHGQHHESMNSLEGSIDDSVLAKAKNHWG